jgi:hypothetical protein
MRARAAQRPGLMDSALGLLAWRTGPALAALVLGYRELAEALQSLARMSGPAWDPVWARLPEGVRPEDLRAAMDQLPMPPPWPRLLPWFVLLAPLAVLSIWLHDAVWDHLGLWLLRGLKHRRSFRETLVAEAEALKVGLIAALAGLLKYLPGVGFAFGVLVLPLAAYFWILRGYALAAWHGCPVWKGVLATILNAAFMGLLVLGILGAFILLVFTALHG